MTRKQVQSGAEARAAYPRLAAWWDAAKAHGTIYSRTDVSRSGMSATVLLWTVGKFHATDDRETIIAAWPDSGNDPNSDRWDECARRIGFSLKRRAFRVGGCGFNRALEVADRIASLFGDDKINGESWQRRVHLDTLNQPE